MDKMKRKFVGIELKRGYWQTAINHLTDVEKQGLQRSFFDLLESDAI